MSTPILVVRTLVHRLLFAKKTLIFKIAFVLSFTAVSHAQSELTATDVFSGASLISSTDDYSQTELEILEAMNIAEGKGIPFNFYGQDFSPQTLIDLYLPKVHLLTDQAKLILPRENLRSEDFKFFFAAHQVFNGILGFPRVSLQDISPENRLATKDQLVRALTKRIAFVAALSQRYDLDWFYSWAARNSYALQTSEDSTLSFVQQFKNSEHLFDMAMGAATGEAKKSQGIIRSAINGPLINAGLPTLDFMGPSDFTTLGEELALNTSPEAVGEMNAIMTPQSSYATYEVLAMNLADLFSVGEFVSCAEQMGLGPELSTWEADLDEKIQMFNSNQFPFQNEVSESDLQLEGKKQRLMQKVQRLAFKLYQLRSNGFSEFDTPTHLQFLGELRREIIGSSSDEEELSRLESVYEDTLQNLVASRSTNSQVPEEFLAEERSFIKPKQQKEEKVLQALRLADIDQVNRTHRERLSALGHDWSQAGTLRLKTSTDSPSVDLSPIVIDAPREMDYIQRLVSLRDAVFHRVNNTFLPMVENSSLPDDIKSSIRTSMSEYLEIFSQKVSQAINRYSQEFLKIEASDDKAKAAVKMSQLESNLSRSLHQNFKAMIEISNNLDGRRRKLRRPLATIRRTIADLNAGTLVHMPVIQEILDQFPAKARIFSNLCTYITKLCIKNQPLTDFVRNRLTYADISRTGKPAHFTGIPVEEIKRSLPDDAVVIVVANHDYAPLDAKVLDELAKQLEARETMFLTMKVVYPHFFVRKNTDPNTFFIEDRSWMKKALARMGETEGRTVFNLFPEGTIPYWFAQFPLVAKSGGFVLARRTAHKLREQKKVFVLEVQTNVLPYMLGNEEGELTAELLPLVEVPNGELDKDDAWVAQMRQSFENRANQKRGEASPVIVKPERFANSRLHQSEGLVRFVHGTRAAHPYVVTPSSVVTGGAAIELMRDEGIEGRDLRPLLVRPLCESYFL